MIISNNMNENKILLLAKQFCKDVFQQKAIYLLMVLFAVLTVYAVYIGHKQMASQNEMKKTYQQAIRKSWEDNPDKHPHRMAHYGSFALRYKHPLSMFDGGMESFTGNAVYLEAHKQNSIIYSEASFSTGMLRLGEISLAMLLQLVLPLILFFIGYNAIAADRENGTLKILLSQGANWKQILLGRSLGLFTVAALLFLPVFICTAVLLLLHNNPIADAGEGIRLLITFISYTVFFTLICISTVLISAISKTAKASLITLLSVWLLLAVVLPKTIQAIGTALYPIPAKVDFETAVEKDILKQGDSHNPDDPFYKYFKDSVLKANNVDSAQKLKFNFGGLVGKKGEQLSSETYVKHQDSLYRIYNRQINFSNLFSFINPFTAVRHQSMVLSGTDFTAYTHFHQQAEQYRYSLAQRMNDLQIELIANKTPKEGSHTLHIDKNHWQEFPDFYYQYNSLGDVLKASVINSIALLCWLLISLLLVARLSKTLKAV
jgi:ABC-2 type transport system permease protein